MSRQHKGTVRRVVTGHSPEGKAIFVSDTAFEPADIPSGDAAFALIWSAHELPVDNNDTTDGREREAGLTLRGGSAIRITDMYPGQQSPFHRTSSIDYGILISGELELELDDGAVKHLQPGDIVVQRGTVHLWRNPSKDKTARIVFVLTAATPVKIDGEDLPDLHPEDQT